MIGFRNRKRDIYLFFVELKRPSKQSKYQVEDDYTKLVKHLKASIDAQANLGIEKPTSFGLLCEGINIFFRKCIYNRLF